MTIIRHELKQGLKAFIIWTAAIAFLLVICIFMFPDMKDEMGDVSEMFSSMGSFTVAFGMDKLNFGTFIGFYAIECGNILGLGGAFFASLIAISSLSKEEKEHTSEFLLTHPVKRSQVVSQKLVSVMTQIVAMNIIIWALALVSIMAIGEDIPWKEMNLMHLAYLIMQLELAGICFGVSAFVGRGSLGIGLGISAIMYFLNIIANISESAHFLKYITPFGYTEGADIVASGSIDTVMVILGMAYGIIVVALGCFWYCKKDIK